MGAHDDAFATFLASRDPAVVQREWTSAALDDVLLEGRTETRATAQARLHRVTAVVEVWAAPFCGNGHQLHEDSVYVLKKSRGEVEMRCKECARANKLRARARRQRKKVKA